MNSLVTADGEIRRPALYETLPGESVGNLLQMAGGVSAQGYSRSASISRYAVGDASRSRIQLNLENEVDLAIEVVDGDFLEVGRVKEDIRSQVVLRGAVARPGGYAWREGLRVSDLLTSIDDDLLNETDLNTGLVVRRTGFGLEVDVLGLSLVDAIGEPGTAKDLLLQAQDEVLIFSLPYFNDSYKALRESLEDSFEAGNDKESIKLREQDEILGQDTKKTRAFSQFLGDQESEEEEKEIEKLLSS